MYGVLVRTGNGYRCSCCRHTYEDLEEYDTLDEALDRIAQIEFISENYARINKIKGSNHDGDVDVLDFFEYKSLDGLHEKEVKARVDGLLQDLVKDEEEKKEDERIRGQEQARKVAERRRQFYQELKREFKDGGS